VLAVGEGSGRGGGMVIDGARSMRSISQGWCPVGDQAYSPVGPARVVAVQVATADGQG